MDKLGYFSCLFFSPGHLFFVNASDCPGSDAAFTTDKIVSVVSIVPRVTSIAPKLGRLAINAQINF